MENNNVTRIIKKFLSGRFTHETEERVQRWIIRDEDATSKEKASLEYWNELDVRADLNTYSALEKVNRRIGHEKEPLKHIAFYRKYGRVAAALIPLILFIGGVVYYTVPHNEQVEIAAAYGEQKRVLLSDSTEVWLNAGSKITFPQTFSDNKRLVTLDGEAHFTVTKDDGRPFIVETSQVSVKVLGTRFNIKAYSEEEKVTTTLTRGKVEVLAQSQHSRILQPNEQLTYDKKTSSIRILTVDAVDVESWITGKVIFTNATPNEIYRTLERRYNTVIDDHAMPASSAKRYTVKFLKEENLDEMLNILSDIIGFTYRKSENEIVLIKP